MAWSFNLGNYSMQCVIAGDPVTANAVDVVVTEGGKELRRESFTVATGEDRIEFVRRVQARVWALQSEFFAIAMAGQQRELERQIRNG